VAAASYLLENPEARTHMASGVNPYGDGKAAARIVTALLNQRTGVQTSEVTPEAELQFVTR
jgi:UDP-N-acetylglucosamine 2-epimerase